MIEQTEGRAGVSVIRSATEVKHTSGGGMVVVPRDSQLGVSVQDLGVEIGGRSVEHVIRVLSAPGREAWIQRIEETEPLSPQDSAGMDMIVYCQPKFAMMTGVSSFTLEVKSSPKRMDEYLRICCVKAYGSEAHKYPPNLRRREAFAIMARERRVITNGQWRDDTILAHVVAQVAEITRVETASNEDFGEFLPADFFQLLVDLGDKEMRSVYQIAETALLQCGYGFAQMYGVEMIGEDDLYRRYMERTVEEDCLEEVGIKVEGGFFGVVGSRNAGIPAPINLFNRDAAQTGPEGGQSNRFISFRSDEWGVPAERAKSNGKDTRRPAIESTGKKGGKNRSQPRGRQR